MGTVKRDKEKLEKPGSTLIDSQLSCIYSFIQAGPCPTIRLWKLFNWLNLNGGGANLGKLPSSEAQRLEFPPSS